MFLGIFPFLYSRTGRNSSDRQFFISLKSVSCLSFGFGPGLVHDGAVRWWLFPIISLGAWLTRQIRTHRNRSTAIGDGWWVRGNFRNLTHHRRMDVLWPVSDVVFVAFFFSMCTWLCRPDCLEQSLPHDDDDDDGRLFYGLCYLPMGIYHSQCSRRHLERVFWLSSLVCLFIRLPRRHPLLGLEWT